MRIGPVEITGLLRLAPMANVTNAPFRLVARECGSALTTTEEMDATGLLQQSPHVQACTAYYPEERPLAMQLLGKDPETLARAAVHLEALGADIVDLNMGCPVPKITGKGKGAALMRDVPAAARILGAMRRAIRIPLTVKIRGGWDDTHLNAVEVARMAEAEGVDALTSPCTRARAPSSSPGRRPGRSSRRSWPPSGFRSRGTETSGPWPTLGGWCSRRGASR